jgi:hypothetical protein
LTFRQGFRHAANFLLKRDVGEDIRRNHMRFVNKKSNAQSQCNKEDHCDGGGQAADSRKHDTEENTLSNGGLSCHRKRISSTVREFKAARSEFDARPILRPS